MGDIDIRHRIGEAVLKFGANAVARALSMPRTTIVSIVAGSARPGSEALASQRIERLSELTGGRAA